MQTVDIDINWSNTLLVEHILKDQLLLPNR